MKLYEIDKALLDVIESGYSVDEDTGEIYFSEDELEALITDRNYKLEGCALYVKNLDAESDAIKAEIERLQARQKAKQRRADYMRQYIAQSMKLFGDTQMETARADVRLRKSTYVDVFNAGMLAPEFVRTKVTTAPDKAAIKKRLQAGELVAGAVLATRTNVVIK